MSGRKPARFKSEEGDRAGGQLSPPMEYRHGSSVTAVDQKQQNNRTAQKGAGQCDRYQHLENEA